MPLAAVDVLPTERATVTSDAGASSTVAVTVTSVSSADSSRLDGLTLRVIFGSSLSVMVKVVAVTDPLTPPDAVPSKTIVSPVPSSSSSSVGSMLSVVVPEDLPERIVTLTLPRAS